MEGAVESLFEERECILNRVGVNVSHGIRPPVIDYRALAREFVLEHRQIYHVVIAVDRAHLFLSVLVHRCPDSVAQVPSCPIAA